MSQPVSDEKSGESLPQIRSVALIALGSNQSTGVGDAAETIAQASSEIGRQLGVIRGLSKFYRTPAFPAGSGPDFVNAALKLETDLSAGSLLNGLHKIEQDFGRVRRERWAARTLDLDLIAFGQTVAPDVQTYQKWADLPLKEQMRLAPPQMILPHPRMSERAFVLVPLNDVASDWHHPVTGLSVAQMLDALPNESVSEVVAL